MTIATEDQTRNKHRAAIGHHAFPGMKAVDIRRRIESFVDASGSRLVVTEVSFMRIGDAHWWQCKVSDGVMRWARIVAGKVVVQKTQPTEKGRKQCR
jgi:hypothetical protein